MSTVAIDNQRTTERLSVFMSEIAESEPIDQVFPRRPLLERLLSSKKTQDGGRQIVTPVNLGKNTTIKDFGDYDTFNTVAQNTAKVSVYPLVNKGGTVVISWEEEREVAGKDHQLFDLLKHRRTNAMETLMDEYAIDLFLSTQDPLKMTALPVAISSTGSTGELSQATDADWAAKQVTGGSFATQGLQDMRKLYNQIDEDGAMPDTIVMNRVVYEYYENAVDADVRYSTVQTGERGFKSLEFKGIPILMEKRCPTDEIYMWDSKDLYMVMDTAGNFNVGQFEKAFNGEFYSAILKGRGNIVVKRRKSLGKVITVAA